LTAIDILKDDTEIVFISGLNLHKTPEPVQEAIASKEADGPTPIVAVFDDKVEERLGIVPYFHMKDVNGFRDVVKALSAWRGEAVKMPENKLHAPETWTNIRGRTLRAAYVNSTEDSVTLRLRNGKLATVPLDQLNDESQTRVAEIAAE